MSSSSGSEPEGEQSPGEEESPAFLDPPPQYTEEEMDFMDAAEQEAVAKVRDRAGHTRWCGCSRPCPVMDTDDESVCCTDEHLKEHFFRLDELQYGHGCVTKNPVFKSVILTQDNLKLMFDLLKKYQKDPQKKNAMKIEGNNSWRYLAYRQFVQWVRDSKVMGKYHVPIPACVIAEIRNVWPDPNGTYVPYKSIDDDE